MNVEALKQAIRVMRDVEARALPFDMKMWCGGPFVEEVGCGTASCAAGWCARDAWFNAQGFTLDKRHVAGRGFLPIFNTGVEELVNWEACAAMFGLTMEDTYFLFFSTNYRASLDGIEPRRVIEHIETLLARHDAAVKHETPARELVPA